MENIVAKKKEGRPRSTSVDRVNSIANQMLQGLTNKKVLKTDLELVKRRFKEIILWTDARLPRSFSPGVLAVIVKAVLWYGKDAIEPFCQAINNGNFKGQYDPANVLYCYLMRQKRTNSKDAYRRTVTVIRYYVTNRQMERTRNNEAWKAHIVPAKTDLFEWDHTFTMMIMPHKNFNPTSYKSAFENISTKTIRETK